MDFKSKDFSKKSKQQLLRHYDKEVKLLSLSLLKILDFRIKSLLSDSGIKKVDLIERNVSQNDGFDIKNNKHIKKLVEEEILSSLDMLILKVSDKYKLKLGTDIILDIQEEEDKEPDLYI